MAHHSWRLYASLVTADVLVVLDVVQTRSWSTSLAAGNREIERVSVDVQEGTESPWADGAPGEM